MSRYIKFFKDALLAFPITFIFQPFVRFFTFLFYFNKMIKWIYANKKNVAFHDFYSPKRNYEKRINLYNYVLENQALANQEIHYFEFGVASGVSFKWWLANNKNVNSTFHGFDTFEGLPESWGHFDKGDMASSMPTIDDARGHFYKGLFQASLVPFIETNFTFLKQKNKKIIHLDADLYSSTVFALAQLYPFLNVGDLILFDEFTVPMHEFKAYDEFISTHYVEMKPIASVNNFFQTAFVLTKK